MCFEICPAIHSFHGILLEFLPNSQDGYEYDQENVDRVLIVKAFYMVCSTVHIGDSSKTKVWAGLGIELCSYEQVAANTLCESLNWGQN